jgi:hypothetical protein
MQTNAVLADVDLRAVEFSIRLSGVGDFNCTLFCPKGAAGLFLDDATIPGRSGLYVFRDGVPVWGGVVWKRGWDEDTTTWRLQCKSWESYAYHMLQLNDLSWTGVDQLRIARDILAKNGLDLESGITWSTVGLSGRLRDREMFQYEYKSVGLELEQLAGLEDGFDFTVSSYVREDGSLGRRYVFGYPRLGTTASFSDPTSLTFDYPGNLAPFELEEDSETGATSLFALGAGEGFVMKVAHAGDGTLGIASVPEKTLAAQDIYTRLNAGLSFTAAWTWTGAPARVLTWAPDLVDEAKQEQVLTSDVDQSKTWLNEYVITHPAPYRFVPTADTEYAPWPRLDAVVQYKDVSVLTTLQQHVNEDLKHLLPPIETWTLQLSPESGVKLPDINIGDSAIFRLRSRRWPAIKQVIRRIVEITVRPGDGGEVEIVKLGLGDEI